MLEYFQHIDEQLFLFVNGNTSPFLDAFMKSVSDPKVAIPLYIFIIHYLVNTHKKQWWIVLVLLFGTVGLADFVSVKLFKEVFERLRPCHESNLSGLVHIVGNHCGGKFGFVSSHATNNFALAIFVGALVRRNNPWLAYVLLFWAVLVSYSRVYLGVHYPGDVLGGALLGSALAFLGVFILRILRKPNLSV